MYKIPRTRNVEGRVEQIGPNLVIRTGNNHLVNAGSVAYFQYKKMPHGSVKIRFDETTTEEAIFVNAFTGVVEEAPIDLGMRLRALVDKSAKDRLIRITEAHEAGKTVRKEWDCQQGKDVRFETILENLI